MSYKIRRILERTEYDDVHEFVELIEEVGLSEAIRWQKWNFKDQELTKLCHECDERLEKIYNSLDRHGFDWL